VVRLEVSCYTVLDCAGNPSSAVTGQWHVLTNRGTCNHCDGSSDTVVLCQPATSHCRSLESQSRASAAPVLARLTYNSRCSHTISTVYTQTTVLMATFYVYLVWLVVLRSLRRKSLEQYFFRKT